MHMRLLVNRVKALQKHPVPLGDLSPGLRPLARPGSCRAGGGSGCGLPVPVRVGVVIGEGRAAPWAARRGPAPSRRAGDLLRLALLAQAATSAARVLQVLRSALRPASGALAVLRGGHEDPPWRGAPHGAGWARTRGLRSRTLSWDYAAVLAALESPAAPSHEGHLLRARCVDPPSGYGYLI
jgi:hypothetical protein